MRRGRQGRGAGVGLGIGVITLAIGGCSVHASVGVGQHRVDGKRVEKAIAGTLSDQVGFAPERVQCPGGVRAKAGGQFTCSVDIDGQHTTFRVVQVDGKGTIRWGQVDAILVRQKVTDYLVTDLRNHGVSSATVDCGRHRVLVVRVGATVTCQASTPDGERGTVGVVVKDKDGTVEPIEPKAASASPTRA